MKQKLVLTSGQPGTSPYSVDVSTVKPSDNGVTMELMNSVNGHNLILTVSTHPDNTARVTIDDKTPKSPRYRVQDVVPETIAAASATIKQSVCYVKSTCSLHEW